MKSILPTRSTQAARPTTRRRGVVVALWVLQVVMAVLLVMVGFSKIAGSGAMVDMFAEIGAGQWLRYLVGGFELAGAAGLLIPRLCGVAALGLVALMIGATVTNVLIIHQSPALPLAFLVGAGAIAWGRWPQTKAAVGAHIR